MQACLQYKDLHFSKQLSLFGGEDTDADYCLQTCTLLLHGKDFSHMLDKALRRIEDSSRLTLHFIMHCIGIIKRPSEKSQTCNSP